MKKLLCLLLSAVMVLGLCACGGTGEEGASAEVKGLQVGYGREKIMPESSVPMAGYTDTLSRMSNGFRDYLYVTCVAFSEGGETVLMITQDLFKSFDSWVEAARDAITAETEIPAERIMICSTHNHGGPDLASNHDSIVEYKNVYTQAMANAAAAAVADMAPATVYSASTETEGLNFPRHYKLSDGSYGGDVFGDFTNNTIEGYANECDTQMQLVKVDREGEKQDILLMNWQAYACFYATSASTSLSADFIAPVRDAIEKETDMLFAYFSGAAGDIKPSSRISGDNTVYTVEDYGAKLAQYAIDALPSMTQLEAGSVKAAQEEFTYAVNHADEDKLEQAEEVTQAWDNQGFDTASALAAGYGFGSVYHAREIVRRIDRPQTDTMELNVVSVGGLAFVAAPYQMFSETGEYIKEKSPFAMTFICSCANGAEGNFATQAAYDYHSYEADTNYFARGCAEDTADKFLEMLNSLK